MIHRKLLKISSLLLVTLGLNAQTVTKLSTDQFRFIEGPAWDGSDLIYFSDLLQSKVFTYSVSTDTFDEAFAMSNSSNGLMFNSNSELIVCEGNSGKVTRRKTDGTVLETLADMYDGARFSSPNDLCVDKKGGVYFTDPNFTQTFQEENRIYYINSNGEISVQETFERGVPDTDANRNKPNGVIISPDGLTLYSNNTFSANIFKYDINQVDGSLSNKTLYAKLPDNSAKTGADGMAVDTAGRLYVAAKQTIQVFNGKRLAPVRTISGFPENTTNCTFGGVNKNILFVTGGKNLYKVTGLRAKGVRHPFDLPDNKATLSVSEVNKAEVVDAIYPMPVVNDSFTVKLKSNLDVKGVTVYSLSGTEFPISSYDVINAKELEVNLNETLLKGSYLLKIVTSNGLLTKKIAIK